MFHLGPLFSIFPLSLTKYSVLRPPQWIGLDNYTSLFQDRLLWLSLKNIFLISIITVPLLIVISFILAVGVTHALKGLVVFRAIYFFPHLVPLVVVALLWSYLLSSGGLVNSILRIFHLPTPAWLSSTHWVIPAISMVKIWGAVGFNILIYMSGLDIIPKEVYDSARVDGAGGWTNLWKITFPLVSPMTFFLVIINLIFTLQTFEIPYIMTGGGPNYQSYTVVYFLYDSAFRNFQMGHASSIGVILFIFIILIVLIQFALQRKWVYYAEETNQ